MKRGDISRRDWLALLGTGAATALTSGITAAPLHGAAQSGGQVSVKPSSAGAIGGDLELLQQLAAARAFAISPVQPRIEFGSAAASGSALGWQMTLSDGWELAEADSISPPGLYASDSSWLKVRMPRPVQYALMETGQVPNLWYGDNFKRLQWVQQRDWHLRRRFKISEQWRGSLVRVRFDAMDYWGMVWLDGEFLGAHEGAYGGPTFDITDKVVFGKEHELLVRLVHESHDMIPNFDSSSENRKPKVVKPDAQDAESYQWGNRYRTMGLEQPIRIVVTGQAYLEAPFVRTDAIASDSATLWAQAMVTNTGQPFDGIF